MRPPKLRPPARGAAVRSGCRVVAALRLFAVLVLSLPGCSDDSSPTGPTSTGPGTTPAGDRTFVGAGDIGWCGLRGAELTAKLLDGIDGTVFTTGDNALFQGTAEQFRDCYHPHWGRHKSRTRPSPGNHDYETPGAAGYFEYFGAAAAPEAPGYYAFTLGNWGVYSLNTNIPVDAASPQVQWLRRELQAAPGGCTLAYMHHPLFSSGPYGGEPRLRELWQVMYDAGVDVVVTGHDHAYERFAPQDPDGRADAQRGIRQFVVGTGGGELYRPGRPAANAEVRNGDTWGVMRFTLRAGGYAWEFVPVEGGTFRDAGTGTCH